MASIAYKALVISAKHTLQKNIIIKFINTFDLMDSQHNLSENLKAAPIPWPSQN